MITKGQAFTFMYETRNKNTGELVTDATLTTPSRHTIKVFYKSGSTWTSQTLVNGIIPSDTLSDITSCSVYIGSDTGMYLFQIGTNYTDCDHIIVSIQSSNTDVVIPLQQFYPVDTSQFSSGGGGPTAAAIAESVWSYGSNGTVSTRTLPTASMQAIADTMLDRSASGHNNSHSLGAFINSGGSSNLDGSTYYVDTTDLSTQVSLLTSQVSALTSANGTLAGLLTTNVNSIYNQLDSIDDKLDDMDDIVDATTLAQTVWSYADDHTASIACLSDIAENVWNYDGSGGRALTTNLLDRAGTATYLMLNNDTDKTALAEKVWSFSTRKLTSRQIGNTSDNLALSGDYTVNITNDNFNVSLPSAAEIATEVWTGGYDRTLTTPNIYDSNLALATTTDTADLKTDIGNVPSNVWSNQNNIARTLTSEDLSGNKKLAIGGDTSNISTSLDDIATALSKVYGVLCHWKIDGNNIVVYDDDNEELMTLPTVKNKYGDILQMGTIPEEGSR